jgi:hypothetical protein
LEAAIRFLSRFLSNFFISWSSISIGIPNEDPACLALAVLLFTLVPAAPAVLAGSGELESDDPYAEHDASPIDE